MSQKNQKKKEGKYSEAIPVRVNTEKAEVLNLTSDKAEFKSKIII